MAAEDMLDPRRVLGSDLPQPGGAPQGVRAGEGSPHQAPPAAGSASVSITPSHELPEQKAFNVRLVHSSDLTTFVIFETVSPPPSLKHYNGEERA